MSEVPALDPEGVSESLARQVDQACNRFEAAWKGGGQPRLEDFVGAAPGPERAALLRELVPLDVYYRRARGQDCGTDDYRARFPDLNPVWLAEAPGNIVQDVTTGSQANDLASGDTAGAELPRERLPSVGDYELLGELGRGGMGVVYQARQRKLDRLVALKMILAGAHAGLEELARLRSEAAALARLQHPNVVQIHEVGEHDGCPFLALEYVTGGSLEQKLDGTPLPARAAAELVQTLAGAVHAAHQRGVVHRDLKPANVLLTAEGAPKVTDFGLAKRLDAPAGGTQSGVIVGTPSYMAPEQAAGRSREIGPAADVYALGAVLYELLTGRPPFRAPTALDTLLQVQTAEPVPPSRFQPGVPRDLETVCLKCLRKEPHQRYGSAEGLADDLQRFLTGAPVSARPVGAWERGVKWVRRHPAPAALAAVSALAALALVGVGVGGVYGTRLASTNAQLESANTQLAQALDATEAKQVEVNAQRAEAERQRTLAERFSYVAHMAVANNAWQQGKTEQALQLLELHAPTPEHPEDLRGFEWYYLRRLCRASRVPLRGHTAGVLALWVSPDGQEVASAGADGTVRVWELGAAGREALTVRIHGEKMNAVAFSPNRRRLAGAGHDGAVHIYDTATGYEVACCKGHRGPVNCVAFSPDGKHVASGSQDMVKVWDAESARELRTLAGHGIQVSCVAFSPDGDSLASGTDASTQPRIGMDPVGKSPADDGSLVPRPGAFAVVGQVAP
jgi:hypothetical protein